MVAEFVTAAVLIVAIGAEAIHLVRTRRLAPLAFGPHRRPALWAQFAPALRVLAIGLTTWGLCTLFLIKPKTHNSVQVELAKQRHVVLLLDVSPSMRLQDAGLQGEQSRTQRARAVLESFFDRVPIQQYKLSVIAFFSKAIPVVVDTKDMEVVKNILNDLPMHFAFQGRKTNLFKGLEEAVKVTASWQPKSTILIVITDGDTIPASGMPKMPASIADVLVVGVGDPVKGKFIDGKNSRQDISTLRQAAARMNGEFHNGNTKHISTAMIRELTSETAKTRFEDLTVREYALLAIAVGTFLLAFLPLLLHYFGTSWYPGIKPTRQAAIAE